MKQAEVAHYRAMLQAQAAEPQRRGLFGGRLKPVVSTQTPVVLSPVGATGLGAGAPIRRAGSLFGRRPPEERAAEAPLLLENCVEPAPRLRLLAVAGSSQLSETPYHAEDLADAPRQSGPMPGVIAGWSSVKPPSAQVRLLRRLGAVVEAERQGLAARLAAAGIDAVGA